ncbi:MAG: heavy-metal-associated domain-containing protein [Sulfuricurvum sp.]|jgi:copper chaperone CopZ|uniref:heavy-metal-associated domain-containing protein n=1 Tax=Sulfuricurvum sp. TaxID=2025608 RepID=UPI0025DC52ED|nr:heavy metal-associated domain-containing protein [Sulfuricurvum sp.]MCI4406421.1 heavy-metal-associated domain-containing protein [Sulfuricurvum sp.]
MKKVLFSLVALVAISSADQLVKLNVSGMMCPACVKNVKGSLNDVKGVKETTVYLKEGKAEVKAAEGTKAEEMCDAVKKAGYGCSVAK